MSRAIERVVVASGNRHKVAEIRVALEHVMPSSSVVGLDTFDDVPEVDESASTFAGNAIIKAEAIAAWLASKGEPGSTHVLADDSGICVAALDGKPGVRSARFAGENATDAENNRTLVRALEACGLEESPAHYVCVLALVRVDGRPLEDGAAGPVVFEGRWDVVARTDARGTGGFGYDPHAWLDGGSRTVAELSPSEKAERSHRGAALLALAQWLGASR